MMATSNHLSLISNNTTGWSDLKADTLKAVMDLHQVSFAFIQEHWQLQNNLYRIQNYFDDYCAFSLPASKKNENIHKGRPSGGLSILYKKSLQRYVNHIQVPNSERVQAIRVSFPQCTYIFINVYFPTDPRRNNFDDQFLLQTLQDIKFILNSNDDVENFTLCGDFNADFNRNTRFVEIVSDFMSECDLTSIWDKFDIDFTYCQPLQNGNYSFSKIDHFIVKNVFLDKCVEGTVLHLGENLSNHDIIFMKIECTQQFVKDSIQEQSPNTKSLRPNWQKATKAHIENLRENVNSLIVDINVPDAAFNCRDLNCQDEDHIGKLDEYATEVLTKLESSVEEFIPHIFNKDQRPNIPGWSEYIAPLKDKMNFWRFLWLSSGKSINTQVHFIYRRVRHQYHYAIRNIKRNTQNVKNQAFLRAAAEGKFQDILKSIKAHRKGKSINPQVVDNTFGDDNISENFSSIYKGIYNHHCPLNYVDLAIDINNSVKDQDIDWLKQITPDLIVKLIHKMNSNKNDQSFNFKSDALKHTSDILALPIANLFKAFLVHGHFTNTLLFCSLIPIVKNSAGTKSQSDNYRLIAISSLLLKLLDLLILHLFSSNLKVDSLQFGFQAMSSTDLCSWTLKESINYFLNAGSPIYLCLLDLQKAFDHVKIDLLFQKLKQRLPGIFVRLILYTYLVQRCYVKWGNATSNSFTISNGLRQGAVASPTFFNVYINDLFDTFRKSNLGCRIGDHYFGILGYADDISLISPSRKGLQDMIDKVSKYCASHGITISTNPIVSKTKTKVILFNVQHQVAKFELYGRDLPVVEKWEHLGHTICQDESDTYDIIRSRGKFISDIHCLHQEMGSLNPYMFLKLVTTYLCAFYGSPLWDLNSKAAHSLYATYNYMIRDTFDLPYGTHRYILRELSQTKPLQVNLEDRFHRFCYNIEKSNRPEVIYLYKLQRFDCRSTFGRNYRNIIASRSDTWKNYRIPQNLDWKVRLIKELIDIKNNVLSVDTLNIEQVKVILNRLCCE